MGAFDSFRFIDETISRVRSGVSGDNPCHAWLFCGPEGVGKKTLAAICARAVNCSGSGEKPCDNCPSCVQYLASSYPDHIVVEYQSKPAGVATIRELLGRLALRPFEDGHYTVVIERADLMTQQAQNALLKTLEEPASPVVFFLLAKNEQAILTTVKSRCRLLRVPPIKVEDCRSVLTDMGVSPDRAAILAEIAQGSVGKAASLDKDEEYWALRERVLKALSGVRKPSDVSAASAILKDDRPRAEQALDIIEQTGEYMLRTGAGEDKTGIALPPYKLLSACITARRMIKSNVAWQAALERLLFDCL